MNDLLSWMMPAQKSTVAPTIDWMFYFITWVSIFFFVLVVGLMVYFCFRYRRRDVMDPPGTGINHHLGLEITWSVVPCFIVVFMFWEGLVGFQESQTWPENSIDIQVNASQWKWEFIYPNGEIDNNLHGWVGQPFRMVMTSADVLHAFFVPVFRVKNDIVPGKFSYVWYEATEAGDYQLYCAEFCGTSHSAMLARVEIHETEAEFDEWLATVDLPGPDEEGEDGQPNWRYGLKQWEKKGCKQCHSLTNRRVQGPGWGETAAFWGKMRQLADGRTVMVDENYFLDSINKPKKDVVEGYPGIMTPQTLKPKHVTGIIKLIKKLKEDPALGEKLEQEK